MTKTWTGKDAGVRAPMTGETPLSAAEVAVGVREGTLTPEQAQARPKAKRKPYEPHGSIKAAALRLVKKAGEHGIHYRALVDSIKGSTRQSVNTTVKRLVAAGEILRREYGNTIVLWPTGTPAEVIDKVFAEVVEARRQFVAKRDADISRRATEKARRKAGAVTWEQHCERLKSGWRPQHMLEAKAQAEARAAIRKEQAEARKLAADLKALEEKEARAAQRKATPAIKKETQAINRIAEKAKGTLSPSPFPLPQARPKATPIEIPAHLVTACRPMTLPHERIQPTGSFGPIGQYDTEPGHLPVALGVAA